MSMGLPGPDGSRVAGLRKTSRVGRTARPVRRVVDSEAVQNAFISVQPVDALIVQKQSGPLLDGVFQGLVERHLSDASPGQDNEFDLTDETPDADVLAAEARTRTGRAAPAGGDTAPIAIILDEGPDEEASLAEVFTAASPLDTEPIAQAEAPGASEVAVGALEAPAVAVVESAADAIAPSPLRPRARRAKLRTPETGIVPANLVQPNSLVPSVTEPSDTPAIAELDAAGEIPSPSLGLVATDAVAAPTGSEPQGAPPRRARRARLMPESGSNSDTGASPLATRGVGDSPVDSESRQASGLKDQSKKPSLASSRRALQAAKSSVEGLEGLEGQVSSTTVAVPIIEAGPVVSAAPETAASAEAEKVAQASGTVESQFPNSADPVDAATFEDLIADALLDAAHELPATPVPLSIIPNEGAPKTAKTKPATSKAADTKSAKSEAATSKAAASIPTVSDSAPEPAQPELAQPEVSGRNSRPELRRGKRGRSAEEPIPKLAETQHRSQSSSSITFDRNKPVPAVEIQLPFGKSATPRVGKYQPLPAKLEGVTSAPSHETAMQTRDRIAAESKPDTSQSIDGAAYSMEPARATELEALPYNYVEIGTTRGIATIAELPSSLPDNYIPSRQTVKIGTGAANFDLAVYRLLSFKFIRDAGVKLATTAPMAERDVLVEQRTNVFGVTLVSPYRVIAVDMEDRKVALVMGTLMTHPERGEERYSVYLNDHDEIMFEVFSFTATQSFVAKLGNRMARNVQSRMIDRFLEAAASPL